MKRSWTLCFCLGLGLGLANFAAAPAPEQRFDRASIDKPFDPVWQAMVETLTELKLPIIKTEKEEGRIETDWVSYKGQKNKTGNCDCRRPGEFSEVDRKGRFKIIIKKVSDAACEIRIDAEFVQMLSGIGRPDRSEPCNSTGKLEGLIIQAVTDKTKLNPFDSPLCSPHS
jgi:hypothetical protein